MFEQMIIHDKLDDTYHWTNGTQKVQITEQQVEEILGSWEMQGRFANYANKLYEQIEQYWIGGKEQ